MNLTLAVTHLAVLLVGFLTGVVATHLRPVKRVIQHEEPPVNDKHPIRERIRGRGPTAGAVALFLVLGGVVTIAFGVQQAGYQQQATERDQCYETWGQDVITTLDTRFTASKKKERADERRDDALDAIILTVAAFQEEPAPANAERKFRAVILEFVRAKLHRDKVKRDLDTTRRDNPYPVIDCD